MKQFGLRRDTGMSMLQDRQTAKSLCRSIRHGSGGKPVSLSRCLDVLFAFLYGTLYNVSLVNLPCFSLLGAQRKPLLFELGCFVTGVWLLVQDHQCVSLVFNATRVSHL